MDVDTKDVLEFLQSAARSLGAEVSSPWFYFQVGVVLLGAGIAYGAGAGIRSRVDMDKLGTHWPTPFRDCVRVLSDHAQIVEFSVLLAAALWLSNVASNFAEHRIAQSGDLTPSVQVLLVKLIRLGLMVFAIAVAMSAVGINLSALAIFSGAAGVGIGFGLQKIVANFISGIILLVDKSVKPGDLVTIGDSSGRISALKTRYISVAAGDGREFLIP